MWDFRLWIVITIMVLLTLLGLSTANAAQWEIVSFNDADHLAALQDSVVAICDTTWAIWFNDRLPVGSQADSLRITITSSMWSDSSTSLMIYFHTITCRQLVGVTARWPRTELKWLSPKGDYPKIYLEYEEIDIPMEWKEVFTPGEAIIFYEPYKEEQ